MVLRVALYLLGAILALIAGLFIWLRFLPPQPAALPLYETPVALKLMADGLTSPVVLESAHDASGRLFVADQTGVIWIITAAGERVPAPFLDLRDQLVKLNSIYDERGLLGLVFHPKFKENGRFFVYYSAPLSRGAPKGWNHTSHLAEFKVSAKDPNLADRQSERILLEVNEPQMNHNGGQLAFGPDGDLYLGLGDGGAENDEGEGHSPQGNGQDTDKLLGKILRLDVSTIGSYKIPSDNPFVSGGGRGEIFAYGLRNPYRFSFDAGGEHELFVADVGQNLWEEVDLVTKGANYGWHIREGDHCLQSSAGDAQECSQAGAHGEPLIGPIVEYSHDVGLAVIGGYVYRGAAIPQLDGRYIFGDWGLRGLQAYGRLFAATKSGNGWSMQEFSIAKNELNGLHVLAFGEDDEHELYLLANSTTGPGGTSGKVFRLIPAH